MTSCEKENAASLLAVTNDYIVALHKVGKLAIENGWKELEREIEQKNEMMEIRARELLKCLMGGVRVNDGTAGD